MNVLSLFDGMSCGRIALERAGVEITNYFACEIDKYAIQVSKHNYDDIQHLGDVTKLEVLCLPKIDLIIGGSPCQGFSFAGKQLNFSDPRSKLFFEFVRLLNDVKAYNPKVLFFLENVQMKKEYQNIISEHLGVQPILINSALVSAQNRKRLYWTNLPYFGLPEDLKLNMNDIHDRSKDIRRVIDFYTTSLKLDATKKRILELEKNYVAKSADPSEPLRVSVIENDTPSGVSRQIDRLYSSSYKSPCLTCNCAELKFDNNSATVSDWRYISRSEAERLQTVPEGYTKTVSKNSAFKMLGNSWNVETIIHFFKWLKIIDEL